jgi:hypothetical protein
VDFDQNDGFNRPFGQQGVIFGNKDAAPDVFRNDFANAPYYLDEAGAHNALFTKAGMYDFQFSWQNDLCCGAGHHDTWLLAPNGRLAKL